MFDGLHASISWAQTVVCVVPLVSKQQAPGPVGQLVSAPQATVGRWSHDPAPSQNSGADGNPPQYVNRGDATYGQSSAVLHVAVAAQRCEVSDVAKSTQGESCGHRIVPHRESSTAIWQLPVGEHSSHSPSQRVSQQIPPAQKPDLQSTALLQADPSARLPLAGPPLVVPDVPPVSIAAPASELRLEPASPPAS